MRLWIEFLTLYLVLPLLLAVVLPQSALFPALALAAAIGLILLAATPGFCWAELIRGGLSIRWGVVLVCIAATAATGSVVVAATEPAAFLVLPREMPRLMLMIALLYPVLSALPQELLFRALYFRRYGSLLPADGRLQVGLNAALFSVAHLMYWSWIVATMTFVGGIVLAWCYRTRGNFPEIVVLHSLAGIVLFALGLGAFFYSGNAVRPF